MERLILTDLIIAQTKALALRLVEEFGDKVSNQKMKDIKERISLLSFFPRYGKHYMFYNNFDVRRLTSRHNYIFYTEKENIIYVLALFDTRQSPRTMRKTVTDELLKLTIEQSDNIK